MLYVTQIKLGLQFAATWMDLGSVILNEVSQRRRNIIWHHVHVNLKRNDTNELTKQKETHRLRKWTHGCQWEWIVKDFGKVIYTLLYLKWMTNKNLLYSKWNSAQCYEPAWMGGEFRGERIHVYVWLSPFTVHLKLSQHWWSAISQYKLFLVSKNKNKKRWASKFLP